MITEYNNHCIPLLGKVIPNDFPLNSLAFLYNVEE